MKIFIHDEERAYVRGAFHLQHVFGTEYRNVLDEQKYTEIISRLISQSNPNFKSFLDVGCGGGHLLKALSQRFPAWEFRGIDPVYSDGSIEHGDLFSSDVRTADVVLLKEVIQHVNRLDYGLYCASKLLNPGGLLIIVDRNPRSFLGFRKPIFEALGRWM